MSPAVMKEAASGSTERLRQWMSLLQAGEPRQVGKLVITPLLSALDGPGPWLLLHEALSRKLIEVTEVGGHGTVNEVQAYNLGDVPILVLEGESMVGAKQNRVVVETVLVAPHTLVTLPVGCVEHGRWSARSPKFDSGTMPVSPEVRRMTVQESASGRGVNQARLWRDVAVHMRLCGVSSPTGDYLELVEARKRHVEDEARAFKVEEGQVGMIAVAGGALVGMELVGHPDAWSAWGGRLIPSYLLWDVQARYGPGATPPAEACVPDAGDGRAWLEAIAKGRVSLRPTRGLGVGITIAGDGFAGAGLWFDDRPAHLAVFEAQKQEWEPRRGV